MFNLPTFAVILVLEYLETSDIIKCTSLNHEIYDRCNNDPDIWEVASTVSPFYRYPDYHGMKVNRPICIVLLKTYYSIPTMTSFALLLSTLTNYANVSGFAMAIYKRMAKLMEGDSDKFYAHRIHIHLQLIRDLDKYEFDYNRSCECLDALRAVFRPFSNNRFFHPLYPSTNISSSEQNFTEVIHRFIKKSMLKEQLLIATLRCSCNLALIPKQAKYFKNQGIHSDINKLSKIYSSSYPSAKVMSLIIRLLRNLIDSNNTLPIEIEMFVGLIDIVWSALEDQISSQSNQLTASSSSVQDIDTWLECMIQTVDGISSLSVWNHSEMETAMIRSVINRVLIRLKETEQLLLATASDKSYKILLELQKLTIHLQSLWVLILRT